MSEELTRPCYHLHQTAQPDTCRTCWFAVHGTASQKAAVARAAGAAVQAAGSIVINLRKVRYEKRDGTVVEIMWDGKTPLEKLAEDDRVAVPVSDDEPGPTEGPGTELKNLLFEAGIDPTKNCGCTRYAMTMNLWGADECVRRRSEIVRRLTEKWAKLGWLEKYRAAKGMLLAGTFSVGGLVDEAIRRARIKAEAAGKG